MRSVRSLIPVVLLLQMQHCHSVNKSCGELRLRNVTGPLQTASNVSLEEDCCHLCASNASCTGFVVTRLHHGAIQCQLAIENNPLVKPDPKALPHGPRTPHDEPSNFGVVEISVCAILGVSAILAGILLGYVKSRKRKQPKTSGTATTSSSTCDSPPSPPIPKNPSSKVDRETMIREGVFDEQNDWITNPPDYNDAHIPQQLCANNQA